MAGAYEDAAARRAACQAEYESPRDGGTRDPPPVARPFTTPNARWKSASRAAGVGLALGDVPRQTTTSLIHPQRPSRRRQRGASLAGRAQAVPFIVRSDECRAT